MARSERVMPVPPEVVWDTLADPAGYAMRARARPLGAAIVTLTMTPLGTGARVEMDEAPRGLLARVLLCNPLADRLLAHRNDFALVRLEQLARRRAAAV